MIKLSSSTAWHHNYGIILDPEAGTEIHKHKNSLHKQQTSDDKDQLGELKRKQTGIIFCFLTCMLRNLLQGLPLGCDDSSCMWCFARDKHLPSGNPSLQGSWSTLEAAYLTVQWILGSSLKYLKDWSPHLLSWSGLQLCSLNMKSLCQRGNQWCWLPYNDLPNRSGRKAANGCQTPAEICDAVSNSSAGQNAHVPAWLSGEGWSWSWLTEKQIRLPKCLLSGRS